jgi:hypothetical protein
MTTQKLIAEYRNKISICEKTIESLKISIRNAVVNRESEGVIDELYADKKTENAKAQLMIQFIKDLEDL